MKKSTFTATLLALACLAGIHSLHAATWDGGGVNTNWSTANNWNPNVAPVTGDPLVFPGSASKLSNTNDFPDLTYFKSITLLVANYNISGNDLKVSNGVLSSQASGTNILALGLQLTQDQSFTVQTDGAFLDLNGDLDLGTFSLTVGGEGNLIANGVVLGSGDIVKNGTGFLRLAGNNLFSGGVAVNGGTLDVKNVAGSAAGSGPVTVESGAELQGNGKIDGEVTIVGGGKVSPGDDQPARLEVGPLTLDPDASFVAQINGPVADTDYSQLKVTGTVTLDQSILRIALGPNTQVGNNFKIIDNDGSDAVVGTFKGLDEGETFHLVGIDQLGFTITYQGGDGNDVVLTSTPTLSVDDVEVIEPSSGTNVATFVVKLNAASNQTVTVQYATAPGSAVAGDDYEVANGTLTFESGVTKKTVLVTIDSDDVVEGTEEFSFKLFTPTNASIVKDEAIGTILPPGSTPGGGTGSGNLPGGNGSNGAADSGGCSLGGRETPTAWPILALGLLAVLVSVRRRQTR